MCLVRGTYNVGRARGVTTPRHLRRRHEGAPIRLGSISPGKPLERGSDKSSVRERSFLFICRNSLEYMYRCVSVADNFTA